MARSFHLVSEYLDNEVNRTSIEQLSSRTSLGTSVIEIINILKKIYKYKILDLMHMRM